MSKFLPGDQVTYVNDNAVDESGTKYGDAPSLTLGGTYEVIDTSHHGNSVFVGVINDQGNYEEYICDRFVLAKDVKKKTQEADVLTTFKWIIDISDENHYNAVIEFLMKRGMLWGALRNTKSPAYLPAMKSLTNCGEKGKDCIFFLSELGEEDFLKKNKDISILDLPVKYQVVEEDANVMIDLAKRFFDEDQARIREIEDQIRALQQELEEIRR